MRVLVLLLIGMFALLDSGCSSYYPKHAEKVLQVVEPFIDLRKEADSESVIFYVAERGEKFKIIGNYNQFFKIELEQGYQGWAAETDVLKAIGPFGRPIKEIKYGLIKF